MRSIFFIFLLNCIYHCCAAQQIPDTTVVSVRDFKPGRIQEYRSDPAFQYDLINEPSQSAWNRFWSWVWGKAGDLLSTPGGARTFKAILIAIAIALLVFFVMKLSGMSKTGLFGKRNTGDMLQYSVSDEDIHAINFQQALEQAISNRNFRLAIRLLYLQSLKSLADRGLIQWQLNKTNSAYVDELKEQLQTNFYRLTIQFENKWYGNMHVNEQEFAAVQQEFEQFNRQLK